MKTVITSTGNKLSSQFDLRFGRAAFFCLYDNETGKSSFHENLHLEDGHGAGPKAAEVAQELGAVKVISGDFGPKAKDLHDKLNIQMVIIDGDNQTVRDVIKKLK
ncbi:MAG: hypothetical protein PF450_13525 [Bacteroidales bacterium]|jgi:predicted Fe-Mo cluster-binding NifX family protein|nr:hypothetical protein [Bacteroidales bacterium]